LATTGAFLKRNTISFKRYLDEYEKLWDITPQRPTTLPEYEARTLYTTWGLSFTRLEREDPDAAQLLALLAYFDNESIWYELLHAGISEVSAGWLTAVAKNDMVFASAMGRLVEYCFVEGSSRTESYSMHACVHDWTLHGLNRDIDVAKYWFAFDCVAGSIGDEDWESLSGRKFQRLAAHAARLIHDRFSGVWDLENTFEQRLNGASDIAEMLRQQTQYDAAEQVFQRTLQGYEKALGSEHISTLDTINNLGVLYKNQGKLNEAEKMYDRALQGYEKALGPEHISTFDTVNNLGVLYKNQGKLNEAEKMYDRALQGYEKALGRERVHTYIPALITMKNTAKLYVELGRADKAEDMYSRALNGFKVVLGRSSDHYQNIVAKLAVLRRDKDDGTAS
jgi:tetratricopeptide (TPR) repeat protein